MSARVFESWRSAGGNSEDDSKTAKLQADLGDVRKTIQAFPLVEALKEIMAHGTGYDGWRLLRPPLLPLDEGQRDQLLKALSSIGFAPGLAA